LYSQKSILALEIKPYGLLCLPDGATQSLDQSWHGTVSVSMQPLRTSAQIPYPLVPAATPSQAATSLPPIAVHLHTVTLKVEPEGADYLAFIAPTLLITVAGAFLSVAVSVLLMRAGLLPEEAGESAIPPTQDG
jgi:hypothetical protein